MSSLRVARELAMAAVVLGVFCALAGCGGGNNSWAPETPGAGAEPQTGQVVVGVRWPELPAENAAVAPQSIHLGANSLRLTVLDRLMQPIGEPVVFTRSRENPTETRALVLPVGETTFIAAGLATYDGTGAVLCKATEVLDVVDSPEPQQVHLSLADNVANYEIAAAGDTPGGDIELKTAWTKGLYLKATTKDGDTAFLPARAVQGWEVTTGDDALMVGAGVQSAVADPTPEDTMVTGVGLKPGQATVKCTVRDYVEGGQVQTREVEQDVSVIVWGPNPIPMEGPRNIGYDEVYRLGYGYDRDTMTGTAASPIKTNLVQLKPREGVPWNRYHNEWGWGKGYYSSTNTETYDFEAAGKYISDAGNEWAGQGSGVWSTLEQDINQDFVFEMHAYKDFGWFDIAEESVFLRDEGALQLLTTTPALFVNLYGKQIVMGVKKKHYVTVRLTASQVDAVNREISGVQGSGSGQDTAGTWEADLGGGYGEVIEKLSQRIGLKMTVDSTVPVAAKLQSLGGVVNSIEDVQDMIGGFGEMAATVEATECVPNGDGTYSFSGDQPESVAFSAAPLSYLMPTIPSQVDPLSDRTNGGLPLEQWTKAYISHWMVKQRLYYLLHDPFAVAKLAYLPDARKQELLDSETLIGQNMAALQAGIAQMVQQGTSPGPLPADLQYVPDINWPNPQVVLSECKVTQYCYSDGRYENEGGWSYRHRLYVTASINDVENLVTGGAQVLSPNLEPEVWTNGGEPGADTVINWVHNGDGQWTLRIEPFYWWHQARNYVKYTDWTSNGGWFIVIRDQDGNIVCAEKMPRAYYQRLNQPWPG